MNSLVIFNGNTDPSQETITDWFYEGDFFYMEAFNIGGGEIEIDAFINVEVTPGIIRAIPIERYSDSIQTNIIDTEILFTVPVQFREVDVKKRIVLLAGEAVSIKITVVTLVTACDRVEDISTRIETISRANFLASGFNAQLQLQQNAALASFALALGAAVPSAGASLVALPGVVLPILTPIPIPNLLPGLPLLP